MDSQNISSSDIIDGTHGEYTQQHQGQQPQNTITAFLAKLWALVNDSTCDNVIAWGASGGSFHVYDQAQFSREILPRYFKHNNFASFIRQLNMYGFRKMSTIEHGSLKNERDDIEFAHPHFLRGQESLLEFIKRRAPETQQQKSSTHGGPDTSSASSALVSANHCDMKSGRPLELVRVLDDVRNLQSKQTSLSDKLSYMQTENQALWGEIGSLRQKHAKQQQIVSKLMEFLLHFVATNSTHSHEQSVEQQAPNEVTINHLFSSQHQQNPSQTQHHANKSPLTLTEQISSPTTLKRKQAALMHADESNKRSAMHQQFSHLLNPGRQQSVTINELSDHDTSAWAHVAGASPLIDLVPSPPAVSSQNIDNNHHHQQSTDYQWSHPTNERLHSSAHAFKNLTQQKKVFSIAANEDNRANSYIPDFILRPDRTSGTQINIEQPIDGTPSKDIKTSRSRPTKHSPKATTLKEEQTEIAPTFATDHLIEALKTSPALAASLYSHNHHQQQIDQSNEPVGFSLDDITGDVDHIQSSLDNIREFMFDNLPEDTTIDDLFDADHVLLSPLLHAAEIPDQTSNILLANIQKPKAKTPGHNQLTQQRILPTPTGETTKNYQSVPTVHNQLLEQLINESAKVVEQQQAINQLEREKSDLQDQIHILEQQTTKRQ